MRFFILASTVLFSLCVNALPSALAQVAELDLGRSEGALGKIDSSEELREATFDSKQRKLLFGFSGSSKTEEEPIEFDRIPWPIRRDVPYRITAEKKQNGNVVLTNPRLELVAKWDDTKESLADNASVDKIDKLISAIPKGVLSVPGAIHSKLEHATVSVIADMPIDQPERKAMVDVYYLQEKSYHGNKQIPFSVFEKASKTCLAACALRRIGKPNPHGSGVLIGKNLVLTCSHNFQDGDRPPDKCHVIFHFTNDDKGAAFKIGRVYYSSPKLDFSLLELGAQVQRAENPAFDALPPPPKLGIEPELEQYAGIYVAGYPQGGPLSVALNSQVVYPFWIGDKEGLGRLITRAVLRMFNSGDEYEANKAYYTPRVKDYFETNYKLVGPSGYYFRPEDEPTIGADPDTKQGDSGAPAFDVERNAVIGLLRAGAPDDGTFPAGANYQNFEAVIPMSQIVAELDQAKPGWKDRFKVTYFDN